MTYPESLEYLANLGKFGINLGLSRIEQLLKLMHNPERRFKTIHITGTNGKGSTTAMLAGVLKASGIRTGMYTSPHLVEYTERIVVDGQAITKEEFAEAVAHTAQYVTRMVADGWEHPTEFEVLTAAAFYCFAAAGVEYAVIEVGLGGLLDSTNVITPEIAVITNVTLEHTDRCGNSIAEIAQHKAGIIKEGVPVVTAAQADALTVIRRTAAETKSPLFVWGRDFSGYSAGLDGWKQKVCIEANNQPALGQFVINLIGSHQVENCAVAVMSALVLADQDERITRDSIRRGLAEIKWPGRFEIIPGHPLIIIDGAHNPAGAERLRENLDLIFPDRNIVFLLGILRDKDVSGIIRNMIKANDSVVVAAPVSSRAGQPDEIAQKIYARKVLTASSIKEGIEKAEELAGPEGVICIAGSLYLVGAARAIIVSGQEQSR